MYRLVYSLDMEHLFEFPADADLREFHRQWPHTSGYIATSVTGCEARQYVAQGRPHSTGLVVRSDGTAGRVKF